MKQKLYIFLTAMLAILSFSACEHDIYIDPERKRRTTRNEWFHRCRFYK
jgi:hypothetical protein